MKGFKSLIALALLGCIFCGPTAQAQNTDELIPVIESAESVFLTAIQAYEDRDFETAARLFGVVANTFDLHEKTTASLLMRGKSLYMAGDYTQASLVLNDFVAKYRTSRYLPDAQLILQFANEATSGDVQDTEFMKLGVALPLNKEASTFTQQMFNGIKLAVDDHNAVPYDTLTGNPIRKIKLIFRDTQNQQGAAQDAIRSLAAENVDAIIGPLFSNEALAAAQIAEQERIVMITPMATDDAVSRDRRYTFQANPTIETRGRLMARMAIIGLGLNELGVLADYNNRESVRMARAFEAEASALEANVTFNEQIVNSRSWFRLSETVSRDTLLTADAIYLPINGGNASNLIGGALTSLDRMGISSRMRLLGNVEWHNISQVSLAGKYTTTYSNDFYAVPTDSVTMEFEERYMSLTGGEISQLAYKGYDVATFMAQQLHRQSMESRPLEQIMREAPLFQGYANRLDFTAGNVNEAMFFHRFKDGTVELIR